jgi:hypothetical protein
MKNLTIHSCLTAAHSYKGSLGQAQLARPTARTLATHANRHAKRAHRARSPRMAVARVAPWRARHRLNDGENPELFKGNGH